jgi:hypothetical protein
MSLNKAPAEKTSMFSRIAGFVAALCLTSAAAQAQNTGPAPVAKTTGVSGVLMQQEGPGQPFRPVRKGDDVGEGVLLVALPEAEFSSTNGAVRATMYYYTGDTLPLAESAARFHKNAKFDFDVTLERGVLLLKNARAQGESHVRLRGPHENWDVTLQTPQTFVVVARVNRQPPGCRLFKDTADQQSDPPKFIDEPISGTYLLVVEGKAVVKTPTASHALRAPPGPAMLEHEGTSGNHVRDLQKTPEEVRPLTEAEKKRFAEACQHCKCCYDLPVAKAVAELLGSTERFPRLVGVATAGALDDLPGLLDAFADPKHPEVRDRAVVALRSWMAQKPGQLRRLYKAMTEDRKMPPKQALSVIALLKGFDEHEQADPALYQALLDGLEHPALAIRELSHWHLSRIAPAGKAIAYDAAAPVEMRREAVAAWRALVPARGTGLPRRNSGE